MGLWRKAGQPPHADHESDVARLQAEAEALIAAGNLSEDRGFPQAALDAYEKAARLLPSFARAHLNRGNALSLLGQRDSALEAFNTALAHQPEYPAVHVNIGSLHLRDGRVDMALDSYRRAIAIEPGFPRAHAAMAAVLESSGRWDEAAERLTIALSIDPLDPALHHALGRVLAAQGHGARAIESYRRALELDPQSAPVHNGLGIELQRRGELDDAIASYARAIALDPEYGAAYTNLGNVHLVAGRIEAAIEAQLRAVAIQPASVQAQSNLGSALKAAGRLDEAVACFRKALDLDPRFAHAHVGLGDALKDLGRLEEAANAFRAAIAIDRTMVEAHTSLLYCLGLDEDVTPESLFEAHCDFGATFGDPLRATWPEHDNDRDPARTLRVGFVSGDLRDHAMAYFLEPLLTGLSKSSALELYIYSTHSSEDEVTQRLRQVRAVWRRVHGLHASELARQIQDDRVDVLVDLSGHTSGNGLLAFARKPAPVQATWIGYLGTTGLPAMDYYLADRHLFPRERFSSQFTEHLVHLPVCAAFMPPHDAPGVGSLPALSNGFVTFGSFNQPRKIRPGTLDTWARLMTALPTSRLLLAGMPSDNEAGPIIRHLGGHGVAADRIGVHRRSTFPEFLRLHQRVDVALDTSPYGGGATTAHALWMGVPTLGIAGRAPTGRLGGAILAHVGLERWVATDADALVSGAKHLTGDLEELANLRAELRDRFGASPACDSGYVASGVERAIRTMWNRWCARLPPVGFAVEGGRGGIPVDG